MLDGLALALRGAFGNRATHKNDELLDAGALEVAEVAYLGSIRQYHRIGSIRVAFKHQQSCDLHLSLSLSPTLSLPRYLKLLKASFFWFRSR